MVKVYGATTALFAQQLWYWQQKSENLIDGRYWVYNTAKEWGNQIGVDEKTIRRSVAKLKAAGVLYVGNYNKAAYDRTAWYSLDGELVAEQTEKCLNEYQKSDYPKRPNGSGQNVHMELPETPAPIPETTTKTTHIYEKAKAFPDAGSSFDEKEKKSSAKRKEKDSAHAGEEKNKTSTSATNTLKLFYDVVRFYQLGVINNNYIRQWASSLESSLGVGVAEMYLTRLLERDLRSEMKNNEFVPQIGKVIDIVYKSGMIISYYARTKKNHLAVTNGEDPLYRKARWQQ